MAEYIERKYVLLPNVRGEDGRRGSEMLTTNVGYVAKLNRQMRRKGRDRHWKNGKSEKMEKHMQEGRFPQGRTIRQPDK